ncbi:MAG TPA: hypothetical protein VJH92_04560 [Candidatus Nanoarchaeia archaeon]|nr:hypothetical protein [Candidatus Nanoarchaeia archaeon]
MENKEFYEICKNMGYYGIEAMLNGIDLEDKAEYIKSVSFKFIPPFRPAYGPDGLTTRINDVWAISIPSNLAYCYIPHTKSKIEIYPKFLEDIQKCGMTYGDLLSVIIDHEGQHAQDRFEQPWKMNNFSLLFSEPVALHTEIRAYDNQERNFSRRGCSQYFMGYIRESRQRYEIRLRNL